MPTSTTQIAVTAASWTDLGAGPLMIQQTATPVRFAIADSQPAPTDPGFLIEYSAAAPVIINTASHMWAIAPSGAGAVTVAPVSPGTVGTDFSANKPTIPNVGIAFASTGTYANYVPIASVPSNASRNNIDVENISGAQIVVVRDDGTAANGAAPVNASVFALGGGASAGAQGGSWSSQTFRGRLQVYAPLSTAVVTVMQD